MSNDVDKIRVISQYCSHHIDLHTNSAVVLVLIPDCLHITKNIYQRPESVLRRSTDLMRFDCYFNVDKELYKSRLWK